MLSAVRALSGLVVALSLCACRDGEGEGLPRSPGATETGDSGVLGRYEGAVADEGFGSALAASGGRVLASAPFGRVGAVFELVGESRVEVLVGGRGLGSALAVSADAALVGDPLRGEALLAAATVAAAPGAGLAVALSESGAWAVATAEGVATAPGAWATASRPGSVAWIGETVGVGTPFGEALLETPAGAVLREEPGDLAGAALASGDLNGDGRQEWVVGAPGADRVLFVDAETLQIIATLDGPGGAFGSALAVADVDSDGVDDLVVGAPRAGAADGAAHLYLRGDLSAPAASWTGSEEGSALGSAVAAGPGFVALGAPGPASDAGVVIVRAAP